MRRLSYLATLAMVALLLVPAAGAQTQDQGVVAVPVPEVRSVFIEDYYFDPTDAVVNSGATMLWSNQGSEPHTVTADDGSFDSGVLNPGDAFLVTFEGAGTVSYHCSLHPEMVGSVTVGGGGTGETTATQEALPTEETPSADATPPAEEMPSAEEAPPTQDVATHEETTTTEEASSTEGMSPSSATEEMPPSSHGP